MEKQKLEADRRLIKALTDSEPLDWTRRPNGDLVYLNAQGQKFVLSDSEIQKIRSATRERGAEMSELRRSPSAISSDSTDAALARKKSETTPAKKSGLRSDTPARGAEMPELKHPQDDVNSGSAPEKKSAEHVESKTDPKPSAADIDKEKGSD